MKGGCLTEGVLILMADGSYKKIEDVNVGDFIQTLENQQLVKETYVYDDKVLYEIEFEDGSVRKVSENHRFLIGEDFDDENNWIEVKDLEEKNITEIYKIK